MKHWKKGILLAAALGLALGLTACKKTEAPAPESSGLISEAAPLSVSADVFAPGTTVGGKDLSGKTLAEGLSICRAAVDEAVGGLEITVKFKDDTVSLTKEDFQAKDVLDLTLQKLLASGKADKLELSYVTDLSDAGKRKLQEAAKTCTVPGKNATVSGFTDGGFTFTDEQKGSRVDLSATLRSVTQLLSQKQSGAVQASFIEIQPETTKAALSQKFRLISSYTTESSNTENGNSNMALALSHVNGTILQPGQVFSYNDCIGDSTDPDYGWKPAGGLVGGLLVQVYGGGICQGSSTLYGAALRAGMEIVERDCHSTPSSYCPIGLDATVDYGNIDFRFRNPLDAPVYISAWMDGVTLHVNFYGCTPAEWDSVEVGSEQTGSEPVPEGIRFVTDDKLAKNEYVRRSSGNTGYSARAWRTYYKGETAVKSEELPSSYYEPGAVTYAVGPDTDTAKVDTTKDSGTVGPDASPSPSPSPSAEPTPSPEPEPQPEPEPEPTPEITPEPEPVPVDDPVSEPSGGDVIDWG